MVGGDGGGEGVDVVERNVGREHESGDTTKSSESGINGMIFSMERD